MKKQGSRGLSLIEVTLALTLLAVIAASVVMITRSSSQALKTGDMVSTLDRRCERVLEEITNRLRDSSAAMLTPNATAPLNSSQVDYQRVIGSAGGAPIWGDPERIVLEYALGEVDDGLDNDGDDLIDECRVVWIENPGIANERRLVLSNWVREYLEGEVLSGTDDNGNGLINERGLSFDVESNRINVRLTLERMDSSGVLITRTFQKTVAFRYEGT